MGRLRMIIVRAVFALIGSGGKRFPIKPNPHEGCMLKGELVNVF